MLKKLTVKGEANFEQDTLQYWSYEGYVKQLFK